MSPRAGRAAAPTDQATDDEGIDVNAVVSYNLRAIRERRGLTQQAVADALARLTGHRLPQASISAMERGFDGERRRRFDAHELYLLSLVFDVPIAYFFLPPATGPYQQLADTHRPTTELYRALIGTDRQLEVLDDRLSEIQVNNPDAADEALAAIAGPDRAVGNWHEHYRTWRADRIREIERRYGNQLTEIAEVLGRFANDIAALGPTGYLRAAAHRDGESADGHQG